MIDIFLCLSQDSETKLFTPAAPRPSPDGAGENDGIDPGGTGRTTVGYNYAFLRSRTQKNLKMQLYFYDFSCDFSDLGFLKHKFKVNCYRCVFKFLLRRVDGKHLMRFQSETSVFKFLWLSLSEA